MGFFVVQYKAICIDILDKNIRIRISKMKLGEWNLLRIDRIKDVGAYLTDGKGLECTWKRSESA